MIFWSGGNTTYPEESFFWPKSQFLEPKEAKSGHIVPHPPLQWAETERSDDKHNFSI